MKLMISFLISMVFAFTVFAQDNVNTAQTPPPVHDTDIKGAITPATPQQQQDLNQDVREHTTKKQHKNKHAQKTKKAKKHKKKSKKVTQ